MPTHSDENESTPDSRSTEVIESRVAAQAPGPGFKLKGRYLIEREIGRGGIGVVYLARDERLHQMPVVIKFLLETAGQNEWLSTKFLQEAEALTRINHPGVVKVIDRDTTDDGKPFFVMEFVSGQPLRAVLTGGIDLAHAAAILRQAGHALGAAHLQGVIHRDLKPDNILLQHLSIGEEQVKLIDFGIAKVHDSQSGSATEVAVIAGSLQYIAPEQLNSQPVTAATDVYALGIVAYEMVTGQRPFITDAAGYLAAVQQLAQLQQSEKIIPPRELRPTLPEPAQALILQALSFDPANRPQDARTFADELAEALTGAIDLASPTHSDRPEVTEVISAAQPPPRPSALETPTESPRKPRGGVFRTLMVVGFLVVIVAVAFFAFAWRFLSSPAAVPPSTGRPDTVTFAAPGRTLTYSLTVQKDPKRYPGSKPFQLPGEVIFSPGDRIRLNVASPQAGYLYIINESPPDLAGVSSYNTLFPSVTSNNGSAEIAAGQSVWIPERGVGFVFDAQQGREKLWLICGAKPISELEAVKRWANPEDKGEIKDLAQVNALREFITRHSDEAITVEKEDAKLQTILHAKSDLLIRLVRLEHH